MFVGTEVMWGQRTHLIEDMAQVSPYLLLDVDLLLEQKELVHAWVNAAVHGLLLNRVKLLEVRDDDLMDLFPQVLLNGAANRLDHVFGKCFIHFFLVVVNGDLRGLQVAHVLQHVERVLYSHQEVVHLV